MSKLDCLSIHSIVVGERHRKDMGDLDALAVSMDELAAARLRPARRHPHRRRAPPARRRATRLDRDPVTVVDLDAVVKGEFAENTVRKDFTLSEVAIRGKPTVTMHIFTAKTRGSA